ncbi:hypothetical protein [Gaoshiqia sediminis]|uniref:Uncharacterized protein n=1 Tax=Gaoshiqia sediminis TaxID=2986998 RepID=A0AA42C823_9BACT|nr:hypothetical protein [Gaoshiqia sediminis]MCW0484189.1 hypothetical protein [Gaoshiqia sediminis]
MKKQSYTGKKTRLVALMLALVFGAIPIWGFAQQNPNMFAVVDYMKVKQGEEGKYLDLEKNFWKPIHQERIANGEIFGWLLFGVRYTGTADEYNYVTVTLFNDPAKLERTFQIDPAKVHPGKDLDKAFHETLHCRDLVRSILIHRVDAAFPEDGPGSNQYLQVNYMKVKPGVEGQYVETEQQVWKPVHQEFIKAGTRSGWCLWQAAFPGGANLPYQFLTIDYLPDFSKIGMADYTDAFLKAHPGKDVSLLTQNTSQSRTLVRSELWEKMDAIFKE